MYRIIYKDSKELDKSSELFKGKYKLRQAMRICAKYSTHKFERV